VLINLVPNGISPEVTGELKRLRIEPTAIIPLDEAVYKNDIQLKPLLGLPDSSKAVQAVDNLMTKLLAVKGAK
jgi:hypothetical protein